MNPVGWFEIYVDDLPRATAFYEQVFQVTLEEITDPSESGVHMLGFPSDMASYGSSGALVKMTDMKAGANSTLVYFSCDDCAVELARAKETGTTILREKFSIGQYGFIALLHDTEGNMIGLHSLK